MCSAKENSEIKAARQRMASQLSWDFVWAWNKPQLSEATEMSKVCLWDASIYYQLNRLLFLGQLAGTRHKEQDLATAGLHVGEVNRNVVSITWTPLSQLRDRGLREGRNFKVEERRLVATWVYLPTLGNQISMDIDKAVRQLWCVIPQFSFNNQGELVATLPFQAWAQLHPLSQVTSELVGGTEPMKLLYETSSSDPSSCPTCSGPLRTWLWTENSHPFPLVGTTVFLNKPLSARQLVL